jgi:hypothetical protein
MIKIHQIGELKLFSDRVGRIHGTEDWCVWLYSLVKMQRAQVILELGSGTFATTLWLAQAVKENDVGHVWSVDHGRNWPLVLARHPDAFMPDEKRHTAFEDYFNHLVSTFELEGYVTFLAQAMPPFPAPGEPIDLLFSDFQHGPEDILGILAFYLPQLADAGSVFIDSAPTHYASYGLLEMLVPLLDAGKIPALLWDRIEPAHRESALEWVRRRSFQLVHLVEAKQRAQNSTAWLRFWPADVRPWPQATFH